jgi:molecular chaperone HscB
MEKSPNRLHSTVPAKCATCDRTLESPLFCSSCRRLYPAEGLNLFELLGLPARYDIDVSEVRRKYFELMRDIHPDRLAADGGEVQQTSMRVSAQINEAYQVLLDPVQRAEYLLELAGGKAAADDKQVPQEVLVDTLELREEIDEARATEDRAALDKLRRQIQDRFEAALEEIGSLTRDLPGTDEMRQRLRGKLNAIRYYRKMFEML